MAADIIADIIIFRLVSVQEGDNVRRSLSELSAACLLMARQVDIVILYS